MSHGIFFEKKSGWEVILPCKKIKVSLGALSFFLAPKIKGV
jgi:hypothetical protein